MAVVLLVGDDRDHTGGLRALLRRDGHEVTWIETPESWSDTERDTHADLIVAAVEQPNDVLGASPASRGFPAPLLLVQHVGDLLRETYLEERLVDRIESPFTPEEFLGRVDALVRVRQVVRRGRGAEARESTPQGRGIAGRVKALLSRRTPRSSKPAEPYLEVAARLGEWADRRDMFEPGHAGRVASFCAMMADALHIADHELEVLLRAAMLHDIGKVALPVDVVRHRGPLDEGKMRLVRTHAERGAALLKALDPEDEAARVILYHHERPDGTGYYQKTSEAVPRSARVLAVAEAYDAMTSARWLETVESRTALDWLRDKRGGQFDSEAVDALVDAMKPRRQGVALST